MKADFWHNRWKNNDTGWHEPAANAALTTNIQHLAHTSGARVFVPMCGKTLDIHWLLENGYNVTGAELNEPAVQELFDELGKTPEVTQHGEHTRYQTPDLTVWVGDILTLSRALLGEVDALYDRGALVALPESMRQQYTPHLIDITDAAPQLLVAFHYDQSHMEGPPFSISETELVRDYDTRYQRTELSRRSIEDHFPADVDIEEVVWLLRPNI